MGKKRLILYIFRAVNYSYEFHFDQNRGLPNWRSTHILCTCLCSPGCIQLHYIPKQIGNSPAVTTYCGTNLFADGRGSAQTINPDLPGRVSTCNGICVCAARRLVQQGGGLDYLSEWQPQGISSGLFFGGLWSNSMINMCPPATASALSKTVP